MWKGRSSARSVCRGAPLQRLLERCGRELHRATLSTGDAIPRVTYGVFHVFPRALTAILVAIPAATKIPLDVVPRTPGVLTCRVDPVTVAAAQRIERFA